MTCASANSPCPRRSSQLSTTSSVFNATTRKIDAAVASFNSISYFVGVGGIRVGEGQRVSVGRGVRVFVGVGVIVGVRDVVGVAVGVNVLRGVFVGSGVIVGRGVGVGGIGVTVGVGPIVRVGLAVARGVGGCPVTTKRPELFHSLPTKICTS